MKLRLHSTGGIYGVTGGFKVSTNDRSKIVKTLLDAVREPRSRMVSETYLRRRRRFVIEHHRLAERKQA